MTVNTNIEAISEGGMGGYRIGSNYDSSVVVTMQDSLRSDKIPHRDLLHCTQWLLETNNIDTHIGIESECRRRTSEEKQITVKKLLVVLLEEDRSRDRGEQNTEGRERLN